VGFGISQKEHIESLKNTADIAIIGSALIDVINNTERNNRADAVKQFLKDLSIE
jgi:tryptophan synthase alpha subunit